MEVNSPSKQGSCRARSGTLNIMLIGLVCLKPNARLIVRPAIGTKPFVNWGLIGTRDSSDFLNLEITFRQDGPEGILAIRPGLDWQGRQTGRRTVVFQLRLECACPEQEGCSYMFP